MSVRFTHSEEELALRKRLLEDPEFRKAYEAEWEARYPKPAPARPPRVLPDLTQQSKDE